MCPSFRAVAADYDGTLAYGPRPDADVLDAIAALRRAGVAMVLVTGRVLASLRADFPDADAHFDAIVGENGALLVRPGRAPRLLADPVPRALADLLRERGVPVLLGQVLVAVDGRHEALVAEAIAEVAPGLELVRNRSALMVLPAGVDKGSGVAATLAELGVACAHAAGVGDAENDLALLAACGLGVAVADAVPALKARAGRVLERPGPAGMAAFLRESALDAPRRPPL